MDTKLIFDIGMHHGLDTEFYLLKGFRVVAVEANPLLVRNAQERFANYLRSEQLVIVNLGIMNNPGIAKLALTNWMLLWERATILEQLNRRNFFLKLFNYGVLPKV